MPDNDKSEACPRGSAAEGKNHLMHGMKRVWIARLQRIMNSKFPTIGAELTDAENLEIKRLLHEGDVLLKDDCNYPLAQLGARVIGEHWIHSAVYLGGNQVIDIGSKPYVSISELDDFLRTSDVAILRPQFKSEEDRNSAIAFLKSALNRPFNRSFNFESTESFYCTQLIQRALAQMPHPIKIENNDIGGKTVILSSSIESCPEIHQIYLSRKGLLRSTLAHMPSLTSLIAGAAIGGKLGLKYTFPGAFIALTLTVLLTEHLNDFKRRRELGDHAG